MKKILTATLVLMLSQIALYAQGSARQRMKPVHQMTRTEDSIFQANKAIRQAKLDSASQVKLTNEINRTPFIFEGTLIETKSFQWQGCSYAAQIIKIHKVFKGNLTCGTVKLISKDGVPPIGGDEIYPGTGYIAMSKGTSAIFFCIINTYPNSSIITMKPDNSNILQINNLIQYYSDNWKYGSDNLGYGSLKFDQYEQIYNRLLQEPGIQKKKCDNMDFKKKDDSISKAYYNKKVHSYPYPSDTTKKPKRLFEPDINNPSKGPDNEEDDIEYYPSYRSGHGPNNEGDDYYFMPTPPPPPPPPPSNDVYYTIANLTFGDYGKTISFDVDISSPSDRDYLLNQAAFFLNINHASGDQVTIVWNTAWLDTNYYVFGVDSEATGYNLWAWDSTYAGMVYVVPYPGTLCTVYITLSACGVSPDISFNKDTTDSFTWVYYPDIGTYIQPTINITSGAFANRVTCTPKITDFTTPMAAGVNDTMVITGYNFGDKGTNSAVGFTNANKPNSFGQMDSLTTDITYWDDSEIDIVMPSVCWRYGYTFTPGSGPVVLQNNSTYPYNYVITTDSLHILYDVTNILDSVSHNKEHFDLCEINGMDGYTVYVDPNLAARDSNVVSCIKSAMLIWSCATNINWQLGKDTPISSPTGRVSYISWGTISDSAPATTLPNKSYCSTGIYNNVGFHTTINSTSYTWFYDPTGQDSVPPGKEDFFHVILHELGHGFGLNHINEHTSVMYYQDIASPTSFNHRMLNLNSSMEVRGGDTIMKFSQNDNMTGCATKMVPLTVVNCNLTPTPLHVTGVALSCTCNKSNTIKLLPTVVGGLRNYTYTWDTIPGKGHINTAVLGNPSDSNPTVKWFTGTPHIIAMQVKVLDNSERRETAYGSIYDTITGDSTASAAYAMHDGPLDVFDEPDVQEDYPAGHNPYVSTDIWNRYKKDGFTGYQEPEYISTLDANYIYVRIWNIGCGRQDTTNADSCSYLHVYWTFAATSERWRCDWIGQTSIGGFTDGKEITPHSGLKLGGLAPGKDTIIAIAWIPPNPADIPDSEYTQVCVLARIIKLGSADSGLNSKYVEEYEEYNNGQPDTPTAGFYKVDKIHSSTHHNVVNHYNIAAHNMHVIRLSDTVVLDVKRSIIINNGNINGYINLGYSGNINSDGNFFDIGSIKIYVGPVIFNRWAETGGSSNGNIYPNPTDFSFEVTDTPGWINNIPLTYLDTVVIYVRFALTSTDIDTIRPSRYLYNLFQYLQITPDSAVPTGGFDYEADVNMYGPSCDTIIPADTVTSQTYYGHAIGLTNPLIVTPDTTLGPVTVSNVLNFNTNITFNIMNAGSAVVASYSASNVSGPVSNNFDITSLPDGFYTAQALEYADVVLTESFLKITPNPVLVYPNPTTGVFSVSTSFTYPTHVFISVYDMAGDLLQQSSPVYIGGLYTYTFDISSYPDGNYIVSTTEDGTIFNSTVEMKISDGGGGGEY